MYPQGCDVHNHLSLFLCVADYDKLLPGWSHFAQFTIAVVNKDPKKSKYSDTLHRFCKKEHDWGWKKFMELQKVVDAGFAVNDTLTIKAQVQVIRASVSRPFRCLDAQYRRELIRVYLTNIEGLCRSFVEESQGTLKPLLNDPHHAELREGVLLFLTRHVRKMVAKQHPGLTRALRGLTRRLLGIRSRVSLRARRDDDGGLRGGEVGEVLQRNQLGGVRLVPRPVRGVPRAGFAVRVQRVHHEPGDVVVRDLQLRHVPVSYTHLTLPTILLV